MLCNLVCIHPFFFLFIFSQYLWQWFGQTAKHLHHPKLVAVEAVVDNFMR